MARTSSPEGALADHAQSYYRFLDKQHPPDYRTSELAALCHAITARENRLVVGLPGVGASNLLRCLVARTTSSQRHILFAYVDCASLEGELTPTRFCAAVAEQLLDQGLAGRRGLPQGGYERLKKVALRFAGDADDRLAVVADKLDPLLMTAPPSFYTQLKALTDLNKRVCYIFAASPRSALVAGPDGLLFAGRWLLVGPLNEADRAGAIDEEAARLGVTWSLDERQRLGALSGGHPGLLRAVSSAVVGEGIDLSAPEGVLVERLLQRGDVRARCLRHWQAIPFEQQVALRRIATGATAPLKGALLQQLKACGLVTEGAGGYEVFSPLFAGFVAAFAPLELPPITLVGLKTAARDGRTIVEAGKLLKGGQEIHVSPNELRLIEFLKRERRICTKDEIIAHVYADEAAAGAGVSDNRLETLVSQTRSRIGSDYIKAHWGKGYEWMEGRAREGTLP